MHWKTSDSMMEPLRRASDGVSELVRERPKRSIIGIVLIALLVILGIWGWPELKRTIHIHRM